MAIERELKALLERELHRAGLAPEEVFAAAAEIVVFGSRAAGCATADSDLDVFCVGRGSRLRTASLDLLWIPEERLAEERWLGSELANHIAAFGIWLKGTGDWALNVHPSRHALARKRAWIRRKIGALKRYWNYLSRTTRQRELFRLRMEILRLRCLCRNEAVPPGALLAAGRSQPRGDREDL